MAATIPAARDAASTASASSPAPQATDRRLRLEDILKLMVADGLVPAADADKLARARGSRGDHPLEFIANQKWKAATAPHRTLTLDWLVQLPARKPRHPYLHLHPPKI